MVKVKVISILKTDSKKKVYYKNIATVLKILNKYTQKKGTQIQRTLN